MSTVLTRVTSLTLAVLVFCLTASHNQVKAASWLDASRPPGWNKAGMPIPAAPEVSGTVDPRCRSMARPSELEQDKSLRDKGWDLVGAYQGGWDIRVVQGTAGYDGMCRPRQYQGFVFVRGIFAGTLSPQPMDSRADGALSQIIIERRGLLSAEYLRYVPNDARCCPSRRTHVEFEVSIGPPVVQPVSAASSATR